MKVITFQNLRDYAYSNDAICHEPLKGLVFDFVGLGTQNVYEGETNSRGKFFAEHGILYVVPYYNPWAWMNQQTVRFVDEIADVLFEYYDLPEDFPIVSSGTSMGGQSALVYMVYGKRTPVACVPNCPVCDLLFHYSERSDLPRTLYSAFGSYPDTLDEALRTASPLHLVDRMPKRAVYHIFHSDADLMVNKEAHSDRFVNALKETHEISYYIEHGRGHCDLSVKMREQYDVCIIDAVLQSRE